MAACEAALKHEIHALTDITGFGIGGHAMEMAAGSGVRLVLSFRELPLYQGAVEMYDAGVSTGSNAGNRAICGERLRFAVKLRRCQEEVFFDPQTSGGLLAALPEDQARAYLRDLQEAGVPAAAIVGRAEAGEPGITVIE
jgi:selenide,water dikinase